MAPRDLICWLGCDKVTVVCSTSCDDIKSRYRYPKFRYTC
jgi:hypothetical protein